MVKNNIESNAVRYITEVLQEQLIMRKNKKGGATVMAQNTTLMQTANTTYKAQQTILL